MNEIVDGTSYDGTITTDFECGIVTIDLAGTVDGNWVIGIRTYVCDVGKFDGISSVEICGRTIGTVITSDLGIVDGTTDDLTITAVVDGNKITHLLTGAYVIGIMTSSE